MPLFYVVASELVCYPKLTPVTTYSTSSTSLSSVASLSSLVIVPVIAFPVRSSPTSTSPGASSSVIGSSSVSSIPLAPISVSTFLASSLQNAIDAGHSSLIFGSSNTAPEAVSSTTVSNVASSVLVGAASRSTSVVALSTSSTDPASSSTAALSSLLTSALSTLIGTTMRATSPTPSSNSNLSTGAPSISSLWGGSSSNPSLSMPNIISFTSSSQLFYGSSFTLSTYVSTVSFMSVMASSSIPASSSSYYPTTSLSPSSAVSVVPTSLPGSSSAGSSSPSLPSFSYSFPSTSAISTSFGRVSSLLTISVLRSSSSTAASSPTSALTSTSTFYSIPTLNPGNGKRGLAYSNNTYTTYFALTAQSSLVSWAYNYFSLPDTNYGGLNPALTFVPMLFNDAPALTSVFAANVNASIAQYHTDSILSFNEPDSCSGGSACMSVNESVTAYRTYIQPFAGRVLLGAPAVTNAGSPGSLTYLANFLGNCTGCTIDFVPIHWYASAYNEVYFQQYIAQAYSVGGGRPLWVTEFGMDADYYDPDVQTFIKASLVFLDNTPYVQRYAYFGAYPADLKNNFSKGFLINAAGTGLSAEGMIFNNYTGS